MNSWIFINSLDKRKTEYRDAGYIYIMRNKIYKESIIKIGKTSRHPQQRLQELSSDTGVPDDFELVYYVHVSNITMAEGWVHRELREKRFNPRKEFFKTDIKDAIRVLDLVAEQLPTSMSGNSQYPGYLPQDLQTEITECPSCKNSNRTKRLLIKIRITCPRCSSVYTVI